MGAGHSFERREAQACPAGASGPWSLIRRCRQTCMAISWQPTAHRWASSAGGAETTVVIGNPPFGKNGRLARAFINKAAEFANWVCFVLPRSMHEANGCGSLLPRLELVYERQVAGGFTTTNAKCNWQEWFVLPEGCRGRRPSEAAPDAQGLYSIVSLDGDYNLVIQRCGARAGKPTICNGTGKGKWYIPAGHPEVLAAFRSLPHDARSELTTHQKSLSARMLHDLLERSLLDQYISQIKGTNPC